MAVDRHHVACVRVLTDFFFLLDEIGIFFQIPTQTGLYTEDG